MKQSFCSNCGKNVSDLGPMSFCPYCGTKILQEQSSANTPEQTPAYQPNPSPAYQPTSPPAYQPTPPPAYQPTSPPAYQPVQPYGGQAPFYSQGFPPAPPTSYPKRLGVGAIIGIVAGAIVLLAVFAFLLLRPGLLGGGKYTSVSTDISGNWDAVLHVQRIEGNDKAEQNLKTITGKDFNYILALQLDEEGRGTAQIVPSQDTMESITGLDARLADGKLKLTGTDPLSFSFEGSVNQKGEMVEGAFIMTTEDGIVVKGTLKAKRTAALDVDDAEVLSPKEEQTTSPEPKPTQKAVPTLTLPPSPKPTATEPKELSMVEFIVGEWISDPYPDGMSDVFIFDKDGSCENVMTVNKDDGTMDGWKTGKWYTEGKENGEYTISDSELTFNWNADWSNGPKTYQIEILDENKLQLIEQYDEGTLITIIHRIVS